MVYNVNRNNDLKYEIVYAFCRLRKIFSVPTYYTVLKLLLTAGIILEVGVFLLADML